MGAVRAAAAVFALGVLVVWLVTPIGNACPDVNRLPAGSSGSSSPSFTPPLTRTCTYSTADGTQARRRYVPVVDWLVLAVVAGVTGVGVGLIGPAAPGTARTPESRTAPEARSEGTSNARRATPFALTLRDRRARDPERERAVRPPSAPSAPRTPPSANPEQADGEQSVRAAEERERAAAERERARRERAKRRGRG
ncbi:MAG: hypothetical protein Q8O56_01210 [Solirubrobacteraceae bacterium]|nr:hypothetical protein [Solirubrobacteraceae bacterium]